MNNLNNYNEISEKHFFFFFNFPNKLEKRSFIIIFYNISYVSRNDGKSQRGTPGPFAQRNSYHCCDTTTNQYKC